MVLDSGRTLVIWAFSLAVSWQPITYKSFLLQLLGFVLLVGGMFIYNDLLFAPFLRSRGILGETRHVQDDFNRPPLTDDLEDDDLSVHEHQGQNGERSPLMST
jgi:hypothetical protein